MTRYTVVPRAEIGDRPAEGTVTRSLAEWHARDCNAGRSTFEPAPLHPSDFFAVVELHHYQQPPPT